MRLRVIVPAVAVVCAGLAAGIFLGDRAGATYARPQLSASSFVQFQQIIHIHFVRMMPPLIITAIVAGAAWLVMLRSQWKSAEFWLVAVATAAILCIFLMTLAVNVPINDQLMTWSMESPPANVRELWAPWERVHTIRTVLAIGAFILEAAALGISKPI